MCVGGGGGHGGGGFIRIPITDTKYVHFCRYCLLRAFCLNSKGNLINLNPPHRYFEPLLYNPGSLDPPLFLSHILWCNAMDNVGLD